jgi:hypothetical protein
MNRALSLFLLGGAALLLLVGGLALGGWYLLNRSSGPDLTHWTRPQDLVDVKAVRPGNALSVMTGESETTALDEALARGDWDSAFALVAYATRISDSDRVGNLLLLAPRFAKAKQTTKALWAFQYATTLTVLSPELSDYTRAQNLFQTAGELRSLGANDAARRTLDQASLVAQSGPRISNATRAELLRRIAATYQAWGLDTLSAQVVKQANTYATRLDEPAEDVVTISLTIPSMPLSLTNAVNNAISARIRATQDLQDQAEVSDPKDWSPDLVSALGDRLYEEDSARLSFYRAQLDNATDPLTRASILREQADWLALKWRVARLGFGVSLVADWEHDAIKIGDALSDTLDELFQNADALANKQGDRAEEYLLRTELVWGRWGLYRNYNETDLRSRLNEANQNLRRAAPDGLFLDSFKRGEGIIYLLVPDSLYGAGDKALP